MRFRARTNDKREFEIQWDRVNAYLSKWKPGTLLDVEIVRHHKKRSDPLRKYYFAAVLPPFMEHLGYDRDEEMIFHRQLKIVHWQIDPDKKGIYRNVPSVFSNESEIPVPVKKNFVDWVIRKAAMEGVYIEDPK